ncbi:DUF4465 domain-containing protein [Bacteroidales bacterium OttesenSCG-928-K03]|nr:DUF4465 domain-containing protein [Bacteroidales bacterium OttesenSCG-928-K03]
MKKKLLSLVAFLIIATNVFCQTATFEDFVLEPESYYTGAESVDGFSSGGFYFGNSYMLYGSYVVWSGFAVSNFTESEFIISDYPNHQYCNVVGSGCNGSSNFAVVYPFDETAKVTMPDDNAMQISGVYVTNSPYATYSIINGDPSIEPFTTGDWFKVVATGKDIDGEVKTTDFYLADYRSQNSEEHYIVNEWMWFDLSVLGEVVCITFDLDASKKNDYGILVPSYFCLDDFNGDNNIGVDNYSHNVNISVFPNPATNYVNVAFNDKVDDNNVMVNIYDINGKRLFTKRYVLLTKFITINLKDYNVGVYLIDIQYNDVRTIQKIIKK